MTSRLAAVAFEADEPARAGAFWAGLLGRQVVEDVRGVLVPGTRTQLGLRFVPSRTVKVDQNPMHLHLTSTSETDQRAIVDRALRLGATHLDVGQLPDERHVVLADPEGNELCVIEPGTSFLAGTGILGELTCEGTRQVGLFWADALGWPLVWDQDQETAVQSPEGGTKVSWGGEPLAERHPGGRQRFELAVVEGEVADEVARLVGRGATRVRDDEGVVELADPDGNAFSLRAAP